MPPKGWRKNADGQYPQPSSKENELISIDDILFPRTTIQKLAKNIVSDDENNAGQMTIAKDSLLALQRSATVFVSHLLFQAKQISKEANRKTVSAQDMLAALERAEFSGFIPEVKQKLSVFEANVASKKQLKAAKPISTEEGEKSVSKKPKLDNESMEIDTEDGDGGKNASRGDDDDDEDDEENSTDGNEEDDENSKQDIEHEDEQDEDEDDDNDETEEDVSNPISALAKEEQELQGVETETEAENKPDSSETEEEEEEEEE